MMYKDWESSKFLEAFQNFWKLFKNFWKFFENLPEIFHPFATLKLKDLQF